MCNRTNTNNRRIKYPRYFTAKGAGFFLLFTNIFGNIIHHHALVLQGDLGAIDEKYDVAISSSCGALDNILVDTIDTAQKCVTFLKTQNIGIATFIGLDKVRVWDAQRHFYTKEKWDFLSTKSNPRSRLHSVPVVCKDNDLAQF